jgi:hypothetical protein
VRIEVLFVRNCPHHPAAVKELKAVLSAEGVADEIQEVEVKDAKSAEEFKFQGSPTIRINGRDIAGEIPSPESFALACRLYPGATKIGIPPAEMIERAVRDARRSEV